VPQTACTPDCNGKQCGPDGCGGVCGVCVAPLKCNETTWQCYDPSACVPNCAGKQCGDDGCGGVCGTCPPGYYCGHTGQCLPTSSTEDAKADTSQASDNHGNESASCPPGYVIQYGTCVEVSAPTKIGASGGGCSAQSDHASSPNLYLICFSLILLAIYRKRPRRRTSK
jgi:hypothetical protein